MKKTETTTTTTTAATATQAPPPVFTREHLHRRCEQINDIDDICDGIGEALDVLYNHFFEEFYKETDGLNRLTGLCGHLETFGRLVHIAVEKISDENERLRAVYETMWAEYQEERERVEAAESAAKEREPIENA